MNAQIWWHLARSSGIVALVLLVLSMVWGILLATRVLKPHDRPAWLLDLHRWFGGLATVMTALHLFGLFMDGFIQFGFIERFVPFASSYRTLAVAIGVFGLYILIAVEATSLLRHRLPKRLWRGVHMLSYLLLWGSAVHAGMAGTDVANRAYQTLAFVLTMVGVGFGVIRVLTPRRGPKRRDDVPAPPPAEIASPLHPLGA